MITELISVGTEILLGNIVNTNSAYLSEKCALLGLSVYYQDVVGITKSIVTFGFTPVIVTCKGRS